MRIHGLMLLRDERDIIVQNLTHLLTWIDTLYIHDLGSTDGTWDVVQDFALRDKRIVPFESAPIIYNDNLRCVLFNQFRDRFDHGDWVMKIDADEIYHVTPPQFLRERLRPTETSVLLQWYFFRLTRSEVYSYDSRKVDVLSDRNRPIDERRRYYKISQYTEPRMLRYRRSMQWPAIHKGRMMSTPFNAGFYAKERLPIRHYPHRDPLQMETRFRLRAKMMSLKAFAGGHWNLDDWRAEIVDDQGIAPSAIGDKRGLAGEQGIDTGELHYWEPGTQLPEKPIQNKIRLKIRVPQRIIHPLLLPLLDRMRPPFDPSYKPDQIPAEVQAALEQESREADEVKR